MNIPRLYHTLKYLKPIQLWYQVNYRFIKPKALAAYFPSQGIQTVKKLSFFPLPPRPAVLNLSDEGYKFTFLNKKKTHNPTIDWGDETLGKLWNYNLQYLDVLRDEKIPVLKRKELLADLYHWLEKGKLPLEPYPVSLRIMNVIRFLHLDQTLAQTIRPFLYAEAAFLSKRLEYHLLGNHLLENGFALLMAGHYFEQEEWITFAVGLLLKELHEQVLNDGAHFERSPMYHQILLFRVLEALAYVPEQGPLGEKLKEAGRGMWGWLERISFKNGDIPHFNDSTDGIAFTTRELRQMAQELGLEVPLTVDLKDSGFRKLENDRLELVANVHGISPDYQPGHAHADHLSFVLYVDQKPFIVDQGISTYDLGERRSFERSTKAHNTVTMNDKDTSEVWSGFRVGKRASVKLTEDQPKRLSAQLRFEKQMHQRTFDLEENALVLHDRVSPGEKTAVLRFYFHPSVHWSIENGFVTFDNGLEMLFTENTGLEEFDYSYNLGFNLQEPAKGLKVLFKKECSTTIKTGQ